MQAIAETKTNFTDLYLSQFDYYDGECYITFNIAGISQDFKTIDVAVTNRGKISLVNYDLYQDCNGDFYFEYGCMLDKIWLKDFEQIED